MPEKSKTGVEMQRFAALSASQILARFTLMSLASQIAKQNSENGMVYAVVKKAKITYNANNGAFRPSLSGSTMVDYQT